MAKNLMIQGTMSNAGKSVLTAGLLRVLHQDGYKVAPFKSQNMALNSFITQDGLEMGRAQVMQAEAAGIEPSVWMNPILLKPNSDCGSQVIVHGEVWGNREAAEYFHMRKKLIAPIMEAYEKLDEQYEYIIIEGAGSPVELNLKENDIVNMGLAEKVDAPVLLVGDIDRGGVFAQLLGTVWLMEDWERARVKGLVINKFRGDPALLEPGPAILYEKCGIPVCGVIPYIPLDLDEEDSLSSRLDPTPQADAALQVVVIRLPHLSNYTDFRVLENNRNVALRYVGEYQKIGTPDLIFLPGSKNTMGDLKWMREHGIEAAIQRAWNEGSRIFGICGGFQMLGEWLSDPDGIEGGGEMKGMGYLPVKTCFQREKHRTRAVGVVAEQTSRFFQELSGLTVEGYEIHMGDTVRTEPGSCFLHLTDQITGAQYEDGCVKHRVCGTYLHGILDTPDFLNGFMAPLFREKGRRPVKILVSDKKSYQEEQYDRLADAVRKHLDMEKVYRVLEQGS